MLACGPPRRAPDAVAMCEATRPRQRAGRAGGAPFRVNDEPQEATAYISSCSKRSIDLLPPSLQLDSWQGRVDLGVLAAHGCLVLYFYAGVGVPGQDSHSEALDTVLQCAFRDLREDLEVHGCQAVGISTQLPRLQLHYADMFGLPHRLLCDSGLLLAEMLGLATSEVCGQQVYERQALLIRDRRIVRAFYPVRAERCAAQVSAWLGMAALASPAADERTARGHDAS
jgi:peroxiredoxin